MDDGVEGGGQEKGERNLKWKAVFSHVLVQLAETQVYQPGAYAGERDAQREENAVEFACETARRQKQRSDGGEGGTQDDEPRFFADGTKPAVKHGRAEQRNAQKQRGPHEGDWR